MDESFRQQFDKQRHNSSTVLPNLLVDMVWDFLIDILICLIVCFIVMKRFIMTWLTCFLKHRLSSNISWRISTTLSNLSLLQPSSFNRRPRYLSLIWYLKATEFQTIFLYAGSLYQKRLSLELAYLQKFSSGICCHFNTL